MSSFSNRYNGFIALSKLYYYNLLWPKDKMNKYQNTSNWFLSWENGSWLRINTFIALSSLCFFSIQWVHIVTAIFVHHERLSYLLRQTSLCVEVIIFESSETHQASFVFSVHRLNLRLLIGISHCLVKLAIHWNCFWRSQRTGDTAGIHILLNYFDYYCF